MEDESQTCYRHVAEGTVPLSTLQLRPWHRGPS